jgi:tRNA C32,U32 (ribose-2'-O)-methylase TrmJ
MRILTDFSKILKLRAYFAPAEGSKMKNFTHPAGKWLLATKDYALLFGLILTISTSVFDREENYV